MPPKANKRRRTTRGNTVVTTTTTTTVTADEKNSNNKRAVEEEKPESDTAGIVLDPYNGELPGKLLEQLSRLKKPFYNHFIESNEGLFTTAVVKEDDPAKETISPDTERKHVLELNSLLNTWEYQYVVSFMYCTFPSFFNKNREKKGYFGKKAIPQPPKLLRDLISSHQNGSSLGSAYNAGIRVSARQQKLNLEKEKELSEKLEGIDFEGQIEYGPDHRKFHELLFLQDVLKYIENGYKFDDDIVAFPEYKGDTFAWLLMELAKVYNQNQSFCDEQGCLLSHENWFSESWSTGNITQKFKILFAVIKFCEIRNIGIRNYINDNMDLFYFPRYDVEIEKTTKTQPASRRSRKKKINGDNEEQKKAKELETILSKVETHEQFMLMHGGKVVKIIRNVSRPLNLPLREEHAYTSEGDPLVNFQEKIEDYCESIKFVYEVVAFEFDSLMNFNTNVTEFYENNLEIEKQDDLKEYSPSEDHAEIDEDYTLRQVYMNTKYGLELFNSRMKQRQSEALFNNKKTSQIFIDKISVKNKQLLEEETKEKSHKQKEYLNKANYLRNKSQRIVRDQLIATLWNRYHSLQLSSEEMKEEEYFNEISTELTNLKFENYFSNVPYLLIWKDEDLKKLEVNDLYFPSTKDVYDMNWLFNCSCDYASHTVVRSPNNKTAKENPLSDSVSSLEGLTVIENDGNIETLHDKNIKGDVINCIRCNKWSHFKCLSNLLQKDPVYAGIVSALNQIDAETLINAKPSMFGIASMGGLEEEEEDIDEASNETEIGMDVEENREASLSKEETESQMMMENLEVSLKSPESVGGKGSRRAAASKPVDYTGKSAYQAVEEEPKVRRSTRNTSNQHSYNEEEKIEEEAEEELVSNGKPSFLSQFPVGPLENLLKSSHPLTKLLFRGLEGKTSESQEDLELIYDTLYQRFYKMICYQCCKNLSQHIIKDQFPELLNHELVRQAKNELAKQKRLLKKQQKHGDHPKPAEQSNMPENAEHGGQPKPAEQQTPEVQEIVLPKSSSLVS